MHWEYPNIFMKRQEWRDNQTKLNIDKMRTGINSIFEDRFKYLKLACRIALLWPFQKFIYKVIARIVQMSLGIYIFIGQIDYVLSLQTLNDVVTSAVFSGVIVFALIMFVHFWTFGKEQRQIYEIMENDWEYFQDKEDLAILDHFTQFGAVIIKWLTIVIPILCSLGIFAPTYGSYFFPHYNFYAFQFNILWFEPNDTLKFLVYATGVSWCITNIIVFDNIAILISFQGFAKLSIIRNRIEKVGYVKDKQTGSYDPVAKKHLRFCSYLHQNYLEGFFVSIEWGQILMLFGVLIGVFELSLGFYYMSENLDNIVELAKILPVVAFAAICLFFICLAGDIMTENSYKLADICYLCGWTNLSQRNLKIMSIFFMRCNLKCQFHFSGIVVLSLQMYIKVRNIVVTLCRKITETTTKN